MIDIRLVREETARLKEMCARRGDSIDVDELARLDNEFRQLNNKLEGLRHQRKAIAGKDNREASVNLREEIKKLEEDVNTCKLSRDALWHLMPNILAEDTPEGADDSGNIEIYSSGIKPAFDGYAPLQHDEIGQNLGILDIARGTKVAGSGFYYWKGMGARLVKAVFQLAMDQLFEKDYIQLITPVLAKEETLFGTGYLPFFTDQIYRVESSNLSLIGTSEQTIVGYHGNEIININELPLKYCAETPCFRTEAGSYGKESRGIFRVHQFHKIEQIVICHPNDSEEYHLQCLENEKRLMEKLEIPYRVVRVCAGDLGAPGYKKYDIEGWFAGTGAYRETHSNTNLLDYQARRSNMRVRKGSETFFPHTISATMVTDRAVLAILENSLQSDGSVIIPSVLRPYLNGVERINRS